MSEVMPQGEALRKAVKWISERREEEPCPPLSKLVEEACLRFNLSPSDAEFLFRFLKGEERTRP
jgi:hypothetical protein